MTDYQRPKPATTRCKSRCVRRFRLVRCSWDASHTATSKWHCDEATTGYIWLVKDHERREAQQ